MALTFGFYDSLNHDRLYNAQQMSAIFDGIINDGVFASVGSHFSVVPGTGMHVLVKSGRAWFNSTWTLNDSDIDLTIDAADSLLGRIDTVVLEVNSEQATRANSIKVVKGTAASTPAKPTLTNTTTVHQHPLAHITVAKNTTAITASMIEIVVGKTDCPFVTAILQTTDITNLFEKWENDFQTWFSTVRSTIDGDVALNLQNQIDANWRKTLRETTPPKIGLARTATPADMFDVLADVGNLHVWRKTVTTSEDVPAVPAGYTLGDVETGIFVLSPSYDSEAALKWTYSSNLTVAGDGTVSLSSEKTVSIAAGSGLSTVNVLAGKYVKYSSLGFDPTLEGHFSDMFLDGHIFYIPSDATFDKYTASDSGDSGSINGWYFNKGQPVTGYPYTPAIPAGTSVTYPVSTNRNAYQEGSDAKPAGYVLGDVVSGEFLLSDGDEAGNSVNYIYGSELSVSANGTVDIVQLGSVNIYGFTSSDNKANVAMLKGSFIQKKTGTNDFKTGVIYYIPDTANATYGSIPESYNPSANPYAVFFDRYQPVTGYAAIPAGTVIEYLGCLGDKARTQVLSYVGTGTSGESNPCSITATFPITKAYALDLLGDTSSYVTNVVRMDELTENFVSNEGFSANTQYSHYGKRSADKKSIFWYSLGKSPDIYQLNVAGSVYVFLVV